MARDRRPMQALTTMRNLLAQGWTGRDLLIDAAAEAIGGGDEALRISERVWLQHFEIAGAV